MVISGATTETSAFSTSADKAGMDINPVVILHRIYYRGCQGKNKSLNSQLGCNISKLRTTKKHTKKEREGEKP